MTRLIIYLQDLPLIRDRILPLIASPTRRRLASGAFWGGVASVATRGFTLVASFLLARILGKSGFGEYGVINTTTAMIGGMAGLGIGGTVVKYVAELKQKDPAKTGRILALSSIVTTISALIYGSGVIFFASWLATETLAATHLTFMLQISAITLALGVINSVQTSALVGCEAFRVLSVINVIQSLAQAILLLLGAWVWGLTGAVAMMAVSALLTVGVTRWLVKQEWERLGIKLQWREACNEWRVLVQYSLPAFLGGLSVGPVFWGCSALLANQPGGYEQLGVYNAANQWQTAVLLFPSFLGSAVVPVMSERHGNGDLQGSVRIMRYMMGTIAIIITPIVLCICLFSPLIMSGYGQSFVSGYWTLCMSVVAAAIVAVITPAGQYLAASGKMWIGFWMNTAWGVCMLVITAFMVKWGAEGVAGARLIAYLMHAAWSLVYIAFILRKGSS